MTRLGANIDSLASVNGYLREVADDPALIGGRITLLTFDSESIDIVRDDVPLAICPPLDATEFVPRVQSPPENGELRKEGKS